MIGPALPSSRHRTPQSKPNATWTRKGCYRCFTLAALHCSGDDRGDPVKICPCLVIRLNQTLLASALKDGTYPVCLRYRCPQALRTYRLPAREVPCANALGLFSRLARLCIVEIGLANEEVSSG